MIRRHGSNIWKLTDTVKARKYLREKVKKYKRVKVRKYEKIQEGNFNQASSIEV